MPNSREPGGPDPLGSVGAAGGSDAPEPAAGAAAPERVAGTAPAGAADANVSVDSPEAIAAGLADGSIDAQTARARLIDAAVRARVPPDAPAETVAAIRAEVEALVGSSPILERLLRP